MYMIANFKKSFAICDNVYRKMHLHVYDPKLTENCTNAAITYFGPMVSLAVILGAFAQGFNVI